MGWVKFTANTAAPPPNTHDCNSDGDVGIPIVATAGVAAVAVEDWLFDMVIVSFLRER
jgi:hypothetical protein